MTNLFSITTIDLLFLLIPIIFYAEIHFRIRGVPSLLYKKEPEIVFDLPHRSQVGQTVPLFLFIKDANQFPIHMEKISIKISCKQSKQPVVITKDINEDINTKFVTKTIYLTSDHFLNPGLYSITAELIYRVGKKRKRIIQDNYRTISHSPFKLRVSDNSLPLLPGWHWGDLHLHSNFTEDQVEFGAPIEASALCAKSVGLDFIAITDHSFDFEDNYFSEDNNENRWEFFLEKISNHKTNPAEFIIMPGEEVSTGNHKNQNVHCLVIGNQTFYSGMGDGAKKLFKNTPTTILADLIQNVRSEDKAIIAAAHPFDVPPLSQKVVLNRGFWHLEDLFQDGLDYWQILNGKLDKSFLEALNYWKSALLDGRRIGIIAGNDAHGNFNCYRQINIPLLKITKHRQQLLGVMRTGVFIEKEWNKESLFSALKKKRSVISTGPLISLSGEQNEAQYHIGDEIKANNPFHLTVKANSTKEFGNLGYIYLYHGSLEKKREHHISLNREVFGFEFDDHLNFKNGLSTGYLRAEVFTSKEGWNQFCLTNPIWIK
jgi:hypothetical protein